MPCHHGKALEFSDKQWAPGPQRALRFDNHIKVLATSVGVKEKGLLAGFNPPKLGSLTLSPEREGGQEPSICQPPCTVMWGLIFYQKQREKRSGPGHHGEYPFTLYTHISRKVVCFTLWNSHNNICLASKVEAFWTFFFSDIDQTAAPLSVTFSNLKLILLFLKCNDRKISEQITNK